MIRDRPVSRVKDLPHGLVSLLVYVRKRRFVCTQVLCERRSFTETTAELPARVKQWNNDPKPFVWKANAEDIIEKVQRGRAALTRQINSTTDD